MHPVARWVGLLTASSFVVGLPIVPFWGVWAQRYSGKAVIIRSAVVEAGVFALLAASHSLGDVAGAMALTGFQLGNTGVMLAAVRRLVPAERVGYAVSLFSVSSPIGMAIGPLAGGWLIDATPLGLHGVYALDAALSVGTALMLQLFYRELRPDRPAGADLASAWRGAWSTVRGIFALPITWRIFAVYALFMVGRQMSTPFLPIAIAAANPYRGQAALTIGTLLGGSALVGAAVTVVAGRLGDRVGFVRVLIGALLAGALLAPLLGLLRPLPALAADLIGWASVTQIAGAMVFALLSTRIPESHRATALNLVYVPLYVAGIVGPALAAALSAFGLPAIFVLAGVLLALGGLCAGLWLAHASGDGGLAAGGA